MPSSLPHSPSFPSFLYPLPSQPEPLVWNQPYLLCTYALCVFISLSPPTHPPPPTTTTTSITPRACHSARDVNSYSRVAYRFRPLPHLHNKRDPGQWENGRAESPTGESKNANICVECKAWDVYCIWDCATCPVVCQRKSNDSVWREEELFSCSLWNFTGQNTFFIFLFEFI